MPFSKKEKIKYCILLTATIKPNVTVFLKRNDPKVREQDYKNVIRTLVDTGYPIVFCESSNYPSEDIKNLLARRVPSTYNLLQFNGGNFPAHLGKSYGELQIIKYALEHSVLLKECDLVIKITGRYSVENLTEVLNAIQSEDGVDIIADHDQSVRHTYSGFFIARPDFFTRYLFPLQEQINDSEKKHFEIALHQAIQDATRGGMTVSNFPVKPIIGGYSGTWGVKMAKGNYKDIEMSFAKISIVARGYWKELVKRVQRAFTK